MTCPASTSMNTRRRRDQCGLWRTPARAEALGHDVAMSRRSSSPSQLPASLADKVFSVQTAASAGLTHHELRARHDIRRVGYGLYAPTSMEVKPGHIAGAICRTVPHAWVSHSSAADVLGITFDDVRETRAPELTVPTARQLVRRSGVQCQVDEWLGLGVGSFIGVRVSSAPRVWVELASRLSDRRAIMLGDHLVRVPRPNLEDRSHPHMSLDALQAFTDELLARMSGKLPRLVSPAVWEQRRNVVTRLKRCADLIRVGADSPPETALRLAIWRAGLPEPHLQYELTGHDGITYSADLAFEHLKIAIHYDGRPHLAREAQARDHRRNNAFSEQGWINLQFGPTDYSEDFRRAIQKLKATMSIRTGVA